MSKPDFLSVFTQGWFDENGELPDSFSVATQGWWEDDIISDTFRDLVLVNDFVSTSGSLDSDTFRDLVLVNYY